LPYAALGQSTASAGFNVRDFGAKADGVTDDAPAINAAIRMAIASGAGEGATVLLPAGRYLLATITQAMARSIYPKADAGIDLARQGGYAIKAHVAVIGARRLTIAGEAGTLLIMRDSTAAGIQLERCDDTVLRQVAIEYDPLPFTQGVIVALNAQNRTFDWKLDTGYGDPSEGYLGLQYANTGAATGRGLGFGNVFTPDGAMKFGAAGGSAATLAAVTALGKGTFRATSRQALGTLAVGDRFGWPARIVGVSGQAAVALTLANRCRLEAVTVHSAPTVAFMANDCDATVFSQCVIEPPKGTNRLYSSNADGIHAKSNRQGPTVENCRFTKMGDDAMTIVQKAERLFGVASPSELIVENSQYQLFRPGDRVAVVSQATGLARGEAKVVDVTVVRYRDRLARRVALNTPIAGVVTVDSLGFTAVPPPPAGNDPTPLAMRPDVIADLDLVGSSFAVRNSTFSDGAASGMRIYATDGLVEGNRFQNLRLHGLLLGIELAWPEVWNAERITIRNNTFSGLSNLANIWLHSLLGDYSQAQGMGNRDITIEGNAFAGYGARMGGAALGAITVSNGESIKIRGNTFAAADASLNPAPQAIRLDLCRDVAIENNAITRRDKTVEPIVLTARADKASVTQNGNKITP
jgi:hypothetical protein